MGCCAASSHPPSMARIDGVAGFLPTRETHGFSGRSGLSNPGAKTSGTPDSAKLATSRQGGRTATGVAMGNSGSPTVHFSSQAVEYGHKGELYESYLYSGERCLGTGRCLHSAHCCRSGEKLAAKDRPAFPVVIQNTHQAIERLPKTLGLLGSRAAEGIAGAPCCQWSGQRNPHAFLGPSAREHADEVPALGGEVRLDVEGSQAARKHAVARRWRRFGALCNLRLEIKPYSGSPSSLVWEKYFVKDAAAWPVHAKVVPPLSQALLNIVSQQQPSFDYLTTDSVFPTICEHIAPRWPHSELTKRDIDALQKADLIEPCDPKDLPTGYVSYVFTVAEVSKQRRRVVHDTISANCLLPEPPLVSFRTIGGLQRLAAQARYACCFDFAAWFYQFPLAPCVRPFFAFRKDTETWQFTRMPMGFTHSVAIAQATSTYLACAAAALVLLCYFCSEIRKYKD